MKGNSNRLQSLDRLDQCFGYAIDMDQGIVLDAEFVMNYFDKSNMQYSAEIS